MHHELSRVERKRDARTAVILDEAMAIVTAEGLDALTLGRLARSLDLVPAALYRYFTSKDALVSALQRRAVALIHTRVRDAVAAIEKRTRRVPPEVAVLAKLFAVAQLYLSLPRTEPETYALVALFLTNPRPLLPDDEAKRTAPVLLALLGDVETVFREANECRALDRGDTFERTLACWAVLQGSLALDNARRAAPALLGSEAVAMTALTAMLAGWGADSGTLRRARRTIDAR
jgi:AcrR family transcriptional regulator